MKSSAWKAAGALFAMMALGAMGVEAVGIEVER